VSSFNKLNNKKKLFRKIILSVDWLILRGNWELERQIPKLSTPQELSPD